MAKRCLTRSVRHVLTVNDYLIALTAPLLFVSCGSDGALSTGHAATRDSAGIAIVHSQLPTTSAWHFGDEPFLVIGMEGDPDTEFDKIIGALALSDGRIIVADAGSGELRFFDRNGTHLNSVGGLGGGPAEFGELEFVARLPGDTIVAFDGRRRTVSWFDQEGKLERSVSTTELVATTADIAGLLDDGSIVFVDHGAMYSRSPAETDAGNRLRDTMTVVRMIPFPQQVDTVTSVECGWGSVQRLAAMGMSQLFTAPMHLTATPLVFAHGREIVVGDCSEYGLHFIDGSSGVLRRIARKEWNPIPSGEGQVANVLRAYQDMVGEAPNPFAQLTLDILDEVPAVDFLPPYAGLPARVTIDSEGYIWVPGYTPAPSAFVFGEIPPVVTARWDVFDSAGRLLGNVEAPAGFRLTDLNAGIAIGAATDMVGVEQVVLYELIG